MSRVFLCFCLSIACMPLWLAAQTDSTAQVADSTRADSLPLDTVLIITEDSIVADTVRGDSFVIPVRTSIPGEEDFGRVDTSLSQLPPAFGGLGDRKKQSPIERIKKRVSTYQERYGPRIYQRADGKTRLYVSLPKQDSINIPFPVGLLPAGPRPPYNPTVAWQRSALIPGWGQAYNRSYWKMPLWWAGYGGMIWWLNLNHQQYLTFGDAYFCQAVLAGDGCSIPDEFASIDTEGLRTQRNAFRQRRDNAILLMVGLHSLQVIEAFVDAHLKGFDVSEDLSYRVGPASPIASFGVAAPGFGLKFEF